MRAFSVVFLPILATALVGGARAQTCPAGPADSIPNAGDALEGMALGWKPERVKRAVPPVLRLLGYRDVREDSAGARFVTAPNYKYPDDPLLKAFRTYPHPGVAVTVVVSAESDSTRLFVFAKSVCASDRAPPSGYSVKVEDTFELFAAQKLAFAIVDRLRRDHPRRL